MAERGLTVDHVTIWRWVQRYAPILNQRIRREMRRPNRSWRVDETYIKVAGSWAYLYRAIDSAGETIEFMLSPTRDLIAATMFLRLALTLTASILCQKWHKEAASKCRTYCRSPKNDELVASQPTEIEK